MEAFDYDSNVLEALDDYHRKSLEMQLFLFEGNEKNLTKDQLKDVVDDDLIFHVPIYDMRDRKYASFCSLLEALVNGEKDPKGNGRFFKTPEMSEFNWFLLFYLFRLCGSGINYVPKAGDNPIGTHGFGNFWLVNAMLDQDYDAISWLDRLAVLEKPFTDNKGYLLPQFSYPEMKKGHLKRFIIEESMNLVREIQDYINKNSLCQIYQVVDYANKWLNDKGYNKQNFVLSATVIDIAEYYSNLVDPYSPTYAGTNAKKCLNALFKKRKKVSPTEFEFSSLQFLAERYDTTPYSAEDSRCCDPIRYFREYQSSHHIALNSGAIYKNNSILKSKLGIDGYNYFVENL